MKKHYQLIAWCVVEEKGNLIYDSPSCRSYIAVRKSSLDHKTSLGVIYAREIIMHFMNATQTIRKYVSLCIMHDSFPIHQISFVCMISPV